MLARLVAIVRAVWRLVDSPFLRSRLTVGPAPVLFQRMMYSPPAVRVSLPRGAEKALSARTEETAEARAMARNFIVVRY